VDLGEFDWPCLVRVHLLIPDSLFSLLVAHVFNGC
jgi:hypothetical protein